MARHLLIFTILLRAASIGLAGTIGAAVDPASIETDTAGRAAAIVRLGQVPGEQVIVAAVANVDTRIVVVFVQPQHFTDMT